VLRQFLPISYGIQQAHASKETDRPDFKRPRAEGDTVHQDQRIGLGLAVLLLGAAGAFFFRNDPKPAHPSPRLKSARALDARISEMQNSPYLPNGDDEQDSPGTSATRVSDRKGSDEESFKASLPKFGTADSSNPGVSRSWDGSSDDGVQELTPIPFPPGVTESLPHGSASTRTAAQSPTPPDHVHVVQKGDTLSSIAAKELGSSGRFLEIFEANRDQLNDANDVRIGMSLRIPSRQAQHPEVISNNRPARPKISAPPLLPPDSGNAIGSDLPPVGANLGGDATDRTATDVAPKKKFEPARRMPLGAQGLGGQSSAVEPSSRPTTRKLSQLPPKDAGGKVAQ
jgi:hypothetical protein